MARLLLASPQPITLIGHSGEYRRSKTKNRSNYLRDTTIASLFAGRGEPKYLRSDNGPQVRGQLLAMSDTESRFIKPDSPWQNGIVESFNGRLRAEFLKAEVFRNMADAQLKLRLLQRLYNEERPHSSTEYLTLATNRRISHESKTRQELYDSKTPHEAEALLNQMCG